MKARTSVRAFTLIESYCIVGVLALLIIIAAVVLLPRGRHGHHTSMRDATQVRGLQQAMTVWADQNQGHYPLPSLIDLNNSTTSEVGSAKNTTANIYSLLLFGGYVPSDILISPSEVNPAIQQIAAYELDAPPKAVDAARALWDPAFSADFTSPGGGNTSYAHLQPAPAEGRLKQWTDTFSQTTPIISNRGPEVRSVSYSDTTSPVISFVLQKSNTFLIHGSPKSWEGNVAYADGAVSFETRTDPNAVRYTGPRSSRMRDVLFYDEPDDLNATNAYLGIFIKAGDKPADFTAIWD